MCDEHTQADAAHHLTRRGFAAIGAGAAALGVMPGALAAPAKKKAPVRRAGGKALATSARRVVIHTPDGKADAFFVAPAAGKHPAVVMWPDIAGLRPAFETMATRLASDGYAVLAVNQYYRSAPAPIMTQFKEWTTPEGQAKVKPMIGKITPEGQERDATAFIHWLDAQKEVSTAHKVGTCGYCMGGPFTVRTAAAMPGRVGAACSFHGAGLVGTDPMSPTQLLAKTHAAYLFAIAQGDDARAPGDKTALREAAAAAHRPAEVEVYPAQHGWTVIDTPIYDEAAAEKAWGRMLATYKQYL